MAKFLKNIKDQFEDTNITISIEDKLVHFIN